ncbi:hypothetical protein UFOVP32_77 [uncultured Caudovirales phage]|uniref:Uncharacterized protein n=1 Tax=uncultured Caudovirales phage TaxID=2100421 RepID=A0A6J5KSG7_9CAUD|nr:hypothetical protein UFOVP32_77 [uncultured Caudovirales phage]CAB4123867.1 hypothetical protein UFOVP50_79 [uncultured Caudovirales phage]
MFEISTEIRMNGRNKVDRLFRVRSLEEACEQLTNLSRQWMLLKRGRKAVRDGLMARLYYTNGKFAGLVLADPAPVPKGDEPGQPKRKKRMA